jgi:hypothetical protein
MIRLLNRRPPDPLGPLPVRLGLAVFFGGLPLLAWWLAWYDLIGPAIILALVAGAVMLGARLKQAEDEDAERRELHRRTREVG